MTFHLDDGPATLSAAELGERAFQGAAALAARGVEPGAPVAVLGLLGGRPIGERVLLGWVRFFPGLGLFLYLVSPVVCGAICHHLPTERFARDPAEWLRLVGQLRATVSVSPASAMASAMRAV